jgi:PD-(D/E)XK nuclease superfamily protein
MKNSFPPPRGCSRPRGRKDGPGVSAKRLSAKRLSAKPQTARERELTTKRRGELSELAFVYRAASEGFAVAKPFGDSERYDCIVDAGHRLWKVQVKASASTRNGLYRVNACRHAGRRSVCYQPGEIDFFAAHIIPEATWFIFPLEAILGRKTIYFVEAGARKRQDLHAEYREAWHLLRER